MGVLKLFPWTIAVCLLVQLQPLNANELPVLDPNCPELEDPFSPTQFAHPSDCNKFYKCSGGYAYPMTCPNNLHWNRAISRCDYPSEAGCDPNVRADPVTQPTGIRDVNCPAVDEWNNPRQLAYPGSCTKFYKCQAGLAYPVDCPAGLHWSTTLNRCDWPSVAGCQSSGGSPTPAPVPTPAPTPAPTSAWTPRPGGIWHPNCPATNDLNNPVRLPYPGDCSMFYMCEAGLAYPMFCPTGYHWSVSSNRCLWPDVAQCSVPTPTSTPAPATPAPSPAFDERNVSAYCRSKVTTSRREYLPHPNDANKFIMCSQGSGWVYGCAPGSTFNVNTSSCSYSQ